MNEASSSRMQGSMIGNMATGATLVAALVGNGLYTDGKGHVDYGDHYTECCHNPDMCVKGMTFAMWIKRDKGADHGIVLDTGGVYYDSTGKTKQIFQAGHCY